MPYEEPKKHEVKVTGKIEITGINNIGPTLIIIWVGTLIYFNQTFGQQLYPLLDALIGYLRANS